MTNDQERFGRLRQDVEKEIREYVYPRSEASVGLPWSEGQVWSGLEKMRRALVDPYWAEVQVRETLEQINLGRASKITCAVVADDREGTLLVWDPAEDEFLLAMKVEGDLNSIGVRGDAVGCFLAI
jgi:hypothetical protein